MAWTIQPGIQAVKAQAARAQVTSYTGSPSTSNQLYEQPKHKATSYTSSPSTGNQLYRQPKHRQPVIQAAEAQATSYTNSPSTGNQL